MPDDTAQREPEWSDSGAVARARLRERLGDNRETEADPDLPPGATTLTCRLLDILSALGGGEDAILGTALKFRDALRQVMPSEVDEGDPALTAAVARLAVLAAVDEQSEVRWHCGQCGQAVADCLCPPPYSSPAPRGLGRELEVRALIAAAEPFVEAIRRFDATSSSGLIPGLPNVDYPDYLRFGSTGDSPPSLTLGDWRRLARAAGSIATTLDDLPATDEGAPPCEGCAKPSTCEDLSGTRLCDDCAEPLLVGQHEGSMDAEDELHATPECGVRPAGEPLAACSYPRDHEGNHYDRSTGIEWVAAPTPPFRSGEYEGAVTGLVFSYHGHQVSLKRDAAGWWYAVGPTAKGAPADCPPRPDCRGGAYPFDDALDLAVDAVRRWKLNEVRREVGRG